jgi:hypothetical protein
MTGKRDRASKDMLAHLRVRFLKKQVVMVFSFEYSKFWLEPPHGSTMILYSSLFFFMGRTHWGLDCKFSGIGKFRFEQVP